MSTSPPLEQPAGAGGVSFTVAELLDRLIASLRDELQQYGELLALLDRRPDFSPASLADEFLHWIAIIHSQAAAIESARAHRDRCHSALAAALDQPSTVPFAVLIPLLPADYQHLVEALVLENNQLLLRAQQRAHQNHLLMSRSAALMERFMGALPALREADTTLARSQTSALPFPFPVTPQFEVVG